MKIHCFDEDSGWGQAAIKVVHARGHEGVLFHAPDQVDEGYAFMRMHHGLARRGRDKAVNAALASRPGITVIPDGRSGELYDDKIAQVTPLQPWLPQTFVVRDRQAAIDATEHLELPFISKASTGAASHNVRLIRTEAEAMREIDRAFGQEGIPAVSGPRQHGYLYWQELCSGNPGDYRVIAVGRSQRIILRRWNRPDRPMASGSGNSEPVNEVRGEVADMLAVADECFAANGWRWAGLDLVKGNDGAWKILEFTVSWQASVYTRCRFIGSGRPFADIYEVLVDCIERGEFDA